MSEPTRLSKQVVALTGCSRREAELYIEGGWVTVDGTVVEEPQFKVAEGQAVALLPDAKPEPVEPVTLLLHKPADYDMGDAEKPNLQLLSFDTRDIDFIDRDIRPLRHHFSRLSAPLPLEPKASGLLVLTQDWQVSRKLTEDAGKVEQEYVVETAGTMAADGLATLNRGFRFKGWPQPALKVSWQNETRLRIAGKGILPGQIDAMCESVGLEARAIKRIRIGSVAMSKLPAGRWRYLPKFKRF